LISSGVYPKKTKSFIADALTQALGFCWYCNNADRLPLRWPARGHLPERSSTRDVHVKGADGEAVFILHCPEGPPELRESYGFGRPELGRIKDALAAVLADLCEEWRQIHGRY
jgi:hypothetical protein